MDDTIIPVAPVEIAQRRNSVPAARREVVFDVRDLTVSYGGSPAIKNVSVEIYRNIVTAIIGPSGCGKSTFIRCLNRMNDLIGSARVEGAVHYHAPNVH